MTFEIIVGVLALAIAAGQVYAAQQVEPRKTIGIASAAGALAGQIGRLPARESVSVDACWRDGNDRATRAPASTKSGPTPNALELTEVDLARMRCDRALQDLRDQADEKKRLAAHSQ
jgi:hypothetical protein